MDEKDLNQNINENKEPEMAQNNGFILINNDEEEHKDQLEYEKTEFDRTEYDMAEDSQRSAAEKDVSNTINEGNINNVHSTQKEIKKEEKL